MGAMNTTPIWASLSDKGDLAMDHEGIIQNPSTRSLCMLVLDTSGSMSGSPIDDLNQSLQAFVDAVRQDEVAACSFELGVISAGGTVCEVLPLSLVGDIGEVPPLLADGITPLGTAVALALHRLQMRQAQYRRAGVACYTPHLVIVSDGKPTDSWQLVAQQVYGLSQQRKLVVMAVGVGKANLDVLQRFSPRASQRLDKIGFRQFFDWLSASVGRVSMSVSQSNTTNLGKEQFGFHDSWS